MKKRKDGPLVKIAQAVDLPPADFEGGAHMEFSGNREVLIEGCRGIMEYSQSEIKLNLGKYSVKFSGNELYIRSMSDNTAFICGQIFSVEFCS